MRRTAYCFADPHHLAVGVVLQHLIGQTQHRTDKAGKDSD